ncbi:MAG: SAM-dependent methyltransferase [Halobacteriovoraceae bacterium]|nr:SAM-dependent methyltransferase [Halobacteriovoraceae bacterium]|tara:strand:+ start:4373 stop:5044 length:672 start_codon:yes stop_codon:yes gene_type:complete
MKGFILLIGFLFLSCSSHKHNHKIHQNHKFEGHLHRFNDAEKWAKVFEDRSRDSWQKPQEVFKRLEIKADSMIADIGSATGYFPVRLARIAEQGRVWGVDIEPDMISFLNRRAKKEQLDNLFSILGTPADPLIPEPVDFIFMVDTYHHIPERVKYFRQLKQYLTPSGQIIIIDFKKKKLPIGPPVEMKMSKAQIVEELSQAGFEIVMQDDYLIYQNVLVFEVK